MPEYSYPGIYLVEVSSGAKPIEGVPTSISTSALRGIVKDLRKRVPALAPEWTDRNTGDPGVTVLELLAWVAEQSLFRAGALPDRAAIPVSRLTALLLAALADKTARPCKPLKRVRFYAKREPKRPARRKRRA